MTYNGSFDGTDDIQYFDSALGSLDSVTVEYLFHTLTSYGFAGCDTTNPCIAGILNQITYGIRSSGAPIYNLLIPPIFSIQRN